MPSEGDWEGFIDQHCYVPLGHGTNNVGKLWIAIPKDQTSLAAKLEY